MIVPRTGSIIFINVKELGISYDPHEELKKEITLYNECRKKLEKKYILLSGDFSKNAPENIFLKECSEFSSLGDEKEMQMKKIILLERALQERK